MSRYKESYKDVQGGDFPLMPEGRYSVKVATSIVKDSKAGNPTWFLELDVLRLKFAGRKLWFNCSMSDAAKGIRKGTLTALGLDTDSEVAIDLIDDVIGLVCDAEVFHDEYNGVKREKIKRLRSKENKTVTAKDVAEELGSDDLPF